MVSKCVALLFIQPRRVMGIADQLKAPAALPPEKRPFTYLIPTFLQVEQQSVFRFYYFL
jgi:hypothetical protein